MEERKEKKRRKIRFSFARVTQPVNRERSGGEKLISISCHLVRVCVRAWYETDALIFLKEFFSRGGSSQGRGLL